MRIYRETIAFVAYLSGYLNGLENFGFASYNTVINYQNLQCTGDISLPPDKYQRLAI